MCSINLLNTGIEPIAKFMVITSHFLQALFPFRNDQCHSISSFDSDFITLCPKYASDYHLKHQHQHKIFTSLTPPIHAVWHSYSLSWFSNNETHNVITDAVGKMFQGSCVTKPFGTEKVTYSNNQQLQRVFSTNGMLHFVYTQPTAWPLSVHQMDSSCHCVTCITRANYNKNGNIQHLLMLPTLYFFKVLESTEWIGSVSLNLHIWHLSLLLITTKGDKYSFGMLNVYCWCAILHDTPGHKYDKQKMICE